MDKFPRDVLLVIASHADNVKTFMLICKACYRATKMKGNLLWKYRMKNMLTALQRPADNISDERLYQTYVSIEKDYLLLHASEELNRLQIDHNKVNQLLLEYQHKDELLQSSIRAQEENIKNISDEAARKLYGYEVAGLLGGKRLATSHKINYVDEYAADCVDDILRKYANRDIDIRFIYGLISNKPTDFDEFDILLFRQQALFLYRGSKGILYGSDMAGGIFTGWIMPQKSLPFIRRFGITTRVQLQTIYKGMRICGACDGSATTYFPS